MKRILSLALLWAMVGAAQAQDTEMTAAQARQYYKNTTKKRVSVHDPSVVLDPASSRYYIFGSHRAAAWTSDMQNWTAFTAPWKAGSNSNAANSAAFTTPKVTTVTKGGQTVSLPQFNAMDWAARTDAAYNIDGNMWAPDVIWNTAMQKWCMYLSINGDAWHSSIILLTADNIEGPYEYQAPVVISGFYDAQHSYKDTDLELVIGTQSTLPSRYAAPWASTGKPSFPNNIDPCVFYDEGGNLWIAYGSWSGGVWMLELDEATGLRDYDVTYNGSNTDPYFGKRVAGGYYVSGEAPYIEYIGGYYYLFMTYGGLDSKGGYVMRVFRSQNPSGPFKDAAGNDAVFSSYKMNYGKNADNRGVKVLGAYADWGFMNGGELSQGHNSIIAAPDGRTYLVYHTRFNDGSEGHQVRVHQVLQNKTGWLVVSPFEYNGDALLSADVAQQELVPTADIAGTYQLLRHKYDIDYANREVVEPVEIVLTPDGKVGGAYSGTWTRDEGTSYLRLVLGGVTYNGVLVEQQMDQQSIKSIAFTGMAGSGVSIWAYRMRPDYALAWQLNHQSAPLNDNATISTNIDLYAMTPADPNVGLSWTSSEPAIVSNEGRYNPEGVTAPTPMVLTARLQAGSYFWQQDYNVKAAAESYPASGDWQTGMLAHYGFNDDALSNSFDPQQKAELKRNGTTTLPAAEADELKLRNGNVVHLKAGAHDRESYVAMPNPFYGRDLADGATLSFWVRRADDGNLWDALFGFYDPASGARFYMTGNCYMGYNDNAGNYLDVNYPTTVQPTYLGGTRWHLLTLVFNRSNNGIRAYIDGLPRYTSDTFAGKLDGNDVTLRREFDYNRILDHLAKCQEFTLGYGSFWGSPEARFDDVVFFDRALTVADASALYTMSNRVFNFGTLSSGIADATTGRNDATPADGALYDLAGRRVSGSPRSGIYVRNGRKIIIK